MIHVKRMTDIPDFPLPARGSANAAGLDLSAAITDSITHMPGTTIKVPTGFAFQIPEGHWGLIKERSSLAKYGQVAVAGVIDADYRGEVMLMLYNNSGRHRTIYPGERIAQMIVQPCLMDDVEAVMELDDTQRGDGGFGSTGTV